MNRDILIATRTRVRIPGSATKVTPVIRDFLHRSPFHFLQHLSSKSLSFVGEGGQLAGFCSSFDRPFVCSRGVLCAPLQKSPLRRPSSSGKSGHKRFV
jgi:hypothetical protein